MLDRFVDYLLAALILSFFLPLLGWYSILVGWDLVRTGLNRKRVPGVDFFKQQIAGEFNFERAIEAYEDLIDSTLAEGRL